MNAKRKFSFSKTWPLGVVVAVLAVTGFAFASGQQPIQLIQAAPTPTPQYQTAVVRRGNLSRSISGTGTVIAPASVDLSFASSGKVAAINVQVGDAVKSGQQLATLDTIPQLKQDLDNAQLALQSAQQALDTYTKNAETNLAQAYSAFAKAETDYATAKANVYHKGEERCESAVTWQYYNDWMSDTNALKSWTKYLHDPKTGYGYDFLMEHINPLKAKVYQDYVNYTYCQGFTSQEIAASQANFQSASANLQAAQAAYQALKANNGIDPNVVAVDQATVKNAQAQLAKAQNDLAGSILISPMDGTVTAVNGSAGQASGTGTFLSIADLTRPVINASIDETDLGDFAVGCPATVQFNAIPDKTFSAQVTQVLPATSNSNNVTSASGYISLKNDRDLGAMILPVGSTATVTITCSQSANALQIPIQAIRQQSGQNDVYVLNSQGQPEKRPVVIGLRTSAFAEVRSGLTEGERVITSAVKP